MKKKLAVMMAIMCACAMTACGGKKTDSEAVTGTGNAEPSAVESESEVLPDESVSAAALAEPMTYEEYAAAEVDDPVYVETYVQAKQSWYDNKATLYTQNQDGAYFIYDMAIPEKDYNELQPGTKILVSGYKAEWSGEIEIIDATYQVVEGDTFIAEPTDITDKLGAEDLIDFQNQYISVKNMKVVATKDAEGKDVPYIYNYDGSGTDGDDLYFSVSKGGEGDPVYTFTVESYLTGAGTDVYEAVKGLEIGQTIDMEGFLYWYEGANPHIVSVMVK